MAIKATTFRQNLYQLLDQVLSEGKPLEIERNGQILRVVPANPKSKFDLLEAHDSINGEPEQLLGLDWSKYWSENDVYQAERLTKRKSTRKKGGR